MKYLTRMLVLALVLLMLLSLGGCAQNSYSVTVNGTVYQVDQQAGTISDGTHTYQYTHSGDKKSYEFTVTYPNGATYSDHSGAISWKGQYDSGTYASGSILLSVVEMGLPKDYSGKGPLFIAAFLLFLIGGIALAFPNVMWYLGTGWRFQNAEPSEAALFMNRAAGFVAIVFGFVLLFVP